MREVKHFLPQRPILLLDLPGQGQNAQLAERLTFAEFADLIDRFLADQGLGKVIPIGLSYGSGIGCAFAKRHPERVECVILCGTTQQIRPRVETTLRASFSRLDQGRNDSFADGVVHHLINLPHRTSTNVTDRLVEAIRAGMVELTENERVRYREGSQRATESRKRTTEELFVNAVVRCSRHLRPSFLFCSRSEIASRSRRSRVSAFDACVIQPI